jgi:hypothetical protein
MTVVISVARHGLNASDLGPLSAGAQPSKRSLKPTIAVAELAKRELERDEPTRRQYLAG